MNPHCPEIAYVLKVFPRFSQTFVVNELLAHEEAGLPLHIYSLRLSDDTCFHASIAQVRSPISHVLKPAGKANDFLDELRDTYRLLPRVMQVIDENPQVPAGDMHQAMVLARTVREQGIRHLHAHFGTIATTVSRLSAAMAGISYSFTAHAKDIYHDSVDPDHFRRKVEDAAAVVTVSQYNLDHLQSKFPAAANRIVHVDNGLVLGDFPFSEPRDRAPLVLGVGRLVEKKGFDHLIRAFVRIRDAMPEARCEIIGAGVQGDELEKLAAELGLQQSLRFSGPQPQAEVRRKLRQASVFAAPCVVAADGDRDGLPTVLLEAMAMGTPIVSTDVTGIPEILDDGITGLAVPQGDDAALANACLQLIGDGSLRLTLATHAREMIEDRFDIKKNSAELRRIFENVSKGGTGPGS